MGNENQETNVTSEQTPAPEQGGQETMDVSMDMEAFGLFEDEASISDDDLMGTGEETETGDGTETPGENETETSPPSGEEGNDDPDKGESGTEKGPDKPSAEPEKTADDETGKPADDGEAGDEKTPQKPPKGFVPHEALHQERAAHRAAKDEIGLLRQENEALKAQVEAGPSKSDEFKDFKVLSQEEFDDLVEEDPQEAIKYQAKAARYEAVKRAESTTKAQKQAQHAQFSRIVDETANAIEEAVPGIYDEKSTVSKELGDFAIKHGFDPNFAGALTDPRTMILTPGANAPVPLGAGALGVVLMVKNLRGQIRAQDPEAIRKEIEEQVRAKATAEALDKIKDPNAPPNIGSAPAAGEDLGRTAPKDEASWEKLSPDEEDKYLGG